VNTSFTTRRIQASRHPVYKLHDTLYTSFTTLYTSSRRPVYKLHDTLCTSFTTPVYKLHDTLYTSFTTPCIQELQRTKRTFKKGNLTQSDVSTFAAVHPRVTRVMPSCSCRNTELLRRPCVPLCLPACLLASCRWHQL